MKKSDVSSSTSSSFLLTIFFIRFCFSLSPFSGDLISAHVGRWNFRDGGDGHEEFRILSQDDIHPLYDEDLLPFDFLLLKLDGQSTKPYIRLNEDPALPAGEISDEVTALGFGCTVHGENQCSVPPILQEVDLTYVSNEECRMSTDGTQDYFDLITDDMLCAGDQGQDGCKGDSGGPLIIRRDTYEDDLLVGITSWYVHFLLLSVMAVLVSALFIFLQNGSPNHSLFKKKSSGDSDVPYQIFQASMRE